MKTIKVIIERSRNSFGAYAENVEGVTGMGQTIEDVKKSIMESLALQQELGNIPINRYKLIFKLDTESLLKYYKGIFTNSAFERLTGINQKLIHHYAYGIKRPRPAQAKKIEAALHNLGRELLSLEL